MPLKSERDKAVQRVLAIEGLANFGVLLAKLAVGLSTGSLAILGDAMHSFTDVANNIVAWFVIRLSSQPPDKKHPYGHRKFESLAVFFLATMLTVLAFELALHVFRADEEPRTSGHWEIAVMLGVLLTNIGLACWERIKARQLDSDILMADAAHTFADVLTTIAVIGGWQLAAAGYVILDKLCALAVAALVFHLALQLFRQAAPTLVDEQAFEPERIHKLVMEVPEVVAISRVRSRTIRDEAFVDMVISVPATLSLEASHHIADLIETKLAEHLQINDVSIHVEPAPAPTSID